MLTFIKRLTASPFLPLPISRLPKSFISLYFIKQFDSLQISFTFLLGALCVFLCWKCDCCMNVPAQWRLPAIQQEAKKPFFQDLFGHREGFGIDHNQLGTAGDFLFYLGTGDFDLRNVSHILPSSVLTLMG